MPLRWIKRGRETDLELRLRRRRVLYEFTNDRRPEFTELGYNQRSPFFPHSIRFVPKSGTDGLKLATWMAGVDDPAKLWLVALHARGPELLEFPQELFFDRDLIWHGQTLGLQGHIAYACVLERQQEVVGLNYVSDLVQRIGRRRAHKTRVEKYFRGWPSLLLNAIMEFARLRGRTGVRSPTAELVMRHTDRNRSVLAELFERVYDRSVSARFRARRDGSWWWLPLADNQDRLVRPVQRLEPGVDVAPVILFHDLGAGPGKAGSATGAGPAAGDAFERLLAIEARAGVRATYNVTGRCLVDVRSPIELAGHALAFRSFDQSLLRRQLNRCRQVDPRLKGYRRPYSLPTLDTRGRDLSWFNFEWLAAFSSALARVGFTPADRLVRIPIACHDRLISGSVPRQPRFQTLVEQWPGSVGIRSLVLRHRSVACWLPHYAEALSRLADAAPFWTADDLANQLFLAEAV